MDTAFVALEPEQVELLKTCFRQQRVSIDDSFADLIGSGSAALIDATEAQVTNLHPDGAVAELSAQAALAWAELLLALEAIAAAAGYGPEIAALFHTLAKSFRRAVLQIGREPQDWLRA